MGLAHILPNNIVPDAVQWACIGLLALGSVGIARRRGAMLDRASWSAFALGASAVVVLVGIALFAPQPPGYSLSLLTTDASAGSPLAVTVCARYPSGVYVRTPSDGDVLTVLVDGRQLGYHLSSEFEVAVPQGHHRMRVELLTSAHREFNPPVAAEAEVTVSSTDTPGTWPACPTN